MTRRYLPERVSGVKYIIPQFRRGRTTTQTRPMTPAEEKAFDEAFDRMGDAFREMDRAFDVLRGIGK